MPKWIMILLICSCFPFVLFGQGKKMHMTKDGIYTPPKHHRANNKLPDTIQKSLDTQYPGWTFVNNYLLFDYMDSELRQQNYPFDPNFIIGDFNGDGHRDYVVQISKPDLSDSTDLFLAFISTPQGFKQSELLTVHGSTDQYLWLNKKGTEGSEVGSDSTYTFVHDAITIVTWERASQTYIYSGDDFEMLITGD